jgi:hypothetical protein
MAERLWWSTVHIIVAGGREKETQEGANAR